ncbi:MAG: hypothetical protein Q8M76_00795, partial [Spirochaetaceae bacterium]|nr:hypothetical protein [Spirochaetaceae bacterium]
MAGMNEVEPLAPECRLACLALASTSIFLSRGPTVVVTAIVSLRLLAGAGARIGGILRESSFIAWMFAFAALLQGVTLRGG